MRCAKVTGLRANMSPAMAACAALIWGLKRARHTEACANGGAILAFGNQITRGESFGCFFVMNLNRYQRCAGYRHLKLIAIFYAVMWHPVVSLVNGKNYKIGLATTTLRNPLLLLPTTVHS